MRISLVYSFRFSAVLALLLLSVTGCKKDDAADALLACRKPSGGIGAINGRSVMFWIAQDFNCGYPKLIQIRNTETGSTVYNGPYHAEITKTFPSQPDCGEDGALTIEVSKGYEYEYTIACLGMEWKNKVTVDCSSDACIPIQLK